MAPVLKFPKAFFGNEAVITQQIMTTTTTMMMMMEVMVMMVMMVMVVLKEVGTVMEAAMGTVTTMEGPPASVLW